MGREKLAEAPGLQRRKTAKQGGRWQCGGMRCLALAAPLVHLAVRMARRPADVNRETARSQMDGIKDMTEGKRWRRTSNTKSHALHTSIIGAISALSVERHAASPAARRIAPSMRGAQRHKALPQLAQLAATLPGAPGQVAAHEGGANLETGIGLA